MAPPGSHASRVAIVGAGIAGLTLALALNHMAVSCQVFEQAPTLGEVGAGIQLAPNATRVLRRLGLAEPLRKAAVRPEAIEMRRWDDGRVLSRTELGAECEQAYSAPYYAMYRPDLQRCLLDAVPSGTIELGRQCVDVTERAEGVELRFADGTRTAADICIGADGIHSVVREALAADRPRFSGQSIYRGTIPAADTDFLLAEPTITIWLGPDRHFVHYPVAAGQLVSFAATSPASGGPAESWSAAAAPEDVAANYAGWHDDIARVVAAARVVNRWVLHDRDTITAWHTPRIALIGDAAHPMLPFMAQGANQAIEDAAVLAACLRDEEHASAALERYETARRERVGRVHEISRGNAVTLHLADGDEQRRRDDGLRARQGLASQRWLYGYDALAT